MGEKCLKKAKGQGGIVFTGKIRLRDKSETKFETAGPQRRRKEEDTLN